MDISCKVCQQSFPIGKSDTRSFSNDEICPHCKNYYAHLYDDGTTFYSEAVCYKNYSLAFLVQDQRASVLELGSRFRIIHSFPFPELTHELALQWMDKLKLYVLYQ